MDKLLTIMQSDDVHPIKKMVILQVDGEFPPKLKLNL